MLILTIIGAFISIIVIKHLNSKLEKTNIVESQKSIIKTHVINRFLITTFIFTSIFSVACILRLQLWINSEISSYSMLYDVMTALILSMGMGTVLFFFMNTKFTSENYNMVNGEYNVRCQTIEFHLHDPSATSFRQLKASLEEVVALSGLFNDRGIPTLQVESPIFCNRSGTERERLTKPLKKELQRQGYTVTSAVKRINWFIYMSILITQFKKPNSSFVTLIQWKRE